MAKSKVTPLEQYTHNDKDRLNNPPVGLVTPETDKDADKKKYEYDPHLDPQLQWAGKAERTSFEVPTVSLHVHERIDPKTIIHSIRNGRKEQQPSLFQAEHAPLREAIEFYKHRNNWTNRLVAGDSLLVMNSLLEKEGMAGKVQMIYFDPPYGIKYRSNFQAFMNNRAVSENDKDEDISSEPEMIRAFRDTWELGLHSYLQFIKDRMLISKELLSDSGSVFIQISDQNAHFIRNILDEVFGYDNFVVDIIFTKTGSKESGTVDPINDHIIWYVKNKKNLKYRRLFQKRELNDIVSDNFKYINEQKKVTNEIPEGFNSEHVIRYDPITSDGFRETTTVEIEFDGKKYFPGNKSHWKVSIEGLERLNKLNRLVKRDKSLQYLRKLNDFPVKAFTNIWNDLGGASNMVYVVQTNTKVLERCILMTTDPGDLVLDITCGSGTTAFVAEQWGRRWVTCDTSRVAVNLAKQRLMTGVFDYYELASADEGVGSGFKYKTVPHITLKSIANNEPPGQETLYDQPFIDNKRMRVTGPFTVEAVPAPIAKSFEDFESGTGASDDSVARSGETLRQNEWKDELLRTGIRGKGGQRIEFTRVELLPATRYIHAEAETKEDTPKRVLVSFGQEFAPLEQRQVELALEEAGHLKPKADILVFAAFEFDAEASKDIDETNWPGLTLLKAQMNADLFTDDLKKKRSSNDSFWLIGQPDVRIVKCEDKENIGKIQVEVLGFDYYNTIKGTVESGGGNNIAMWMLDTDYDGRSLFPSQVFLPMAGDKEGWSKLAKNLKAEIDEDRLEMFRGTVSIPFAPGKQIAVKIVDDRGIESMRIIRL